MQFRESTQEDFDYLADHTISRGILKRQPAQVDYYYTLEHEGIPLGIGGFRLINLTTAWAWIDLSDEAKKHIRIVYRTIKEWADIFVKEHKLKRLQAYVETDFPEAIRVAEHLGFRKEFDKPMKNFVGDKDAYMYVRLI